MLPDLNPPLPPYAGFDPLVPVWCATPECGGCIHRFFDTSPFSPSGQYLAVTRMPGEDRVPQPGDLAEIVLVDLHTGEPRVVAQTRGWDTQLGAQAQWGVDDSQLFYNDLDPATWSPHSVVLDPASGARRHLTGTVYMVSPDARQVASPDLTRMAFTQKGYGVLLPPERAHKNEGAPADDGLYITDIADGQQRLLVSLAQVVATALSAAEQEERRGGDYYAFHVKWNPQGDRLMLVLRWVPGDGGKMKHDVITLRADGSDLCAAIPEALWGRGGHHPNWCPDGEHVMMNLKEDGEHLRFVRARHDGSDFTVMSEAVPGSGHPTLHPDGRHVLTDVYLHEPLAFGDGTTPIRWIDLVTGQDQTLVRINNDPPFPGPVRELRIDPHPAWDRTYRWVAFNGCEDGVRRVYVADLSALLDSGSAE